jgi:glycosyltransferase involved in cell wall biosynthesis
MDAAVRVLYLWDADYPWDVRTEKICAALTAAGDDVHIIARNRGWLDETEHLAEGTVHRLRPWRWAGRGLDAALSFPAFVSPRWAALVRRTMDTVRPDAVIVRDLPLCPLAIRAARRAGVPIVLDMAENYPAMIRAVWTAGRHKPWDVVLRNPWLVAAVERWCLPRLDAVLVVVEESADRLVALGVAAERITVVSNTPPRERATRPGNRARAAGSPLEVIYLGLMEIPRGVEEALRAVRRLRDLGHAVRLRLIGDGRDLHLFEREAAALGLTSRDVQFLGRVPNRRALELVAEADLGLVPHHADEAWNTTIPNKLFDYMAAGLAVVTSDAAPAARIVRETGAGLVFRAGDAEDLARAVAALSDGPRRAACADAARQAILERFHWERDAARLVAAIRRGHDRLALLRAVPAGVR